MNCTRCDGSGFLNAGQLPPEADHWEHDRILKWCHTNENHDVTICDCCGDGDAWYGTPGEHYGHDDPRGPHGPYANNGGLCRCN